MTQPPAGGFPAIELRGPVEALDQSLDLLVASGCLGTEELDSDSASAWRAFFPEGADLTSLLVELGRDLPTLHCQQLDSIPKRDWLSEWREALVGVELGESFYVNPSHRPPPETDRRVLTIDPEQAFGTGTHETTRLTAALIEQHATTGASFLDVGTGTGILAMVAAKLGCTPVWALEPDTNALACARKNLRRNNIDSIALRRAGWEIIPEWITEPVDIIVANIQSSVLEPALPSFVRVSRPDSMVILSGLLVEELDAFSSRLPTELEICERRVSGEWAALRLRRR